MIVSTPARRVVVAGASGYIGRALVAELVVRGHDVVALCRPDPAGGTELASALAPAQLRCGDFTDADALAKDGFAGPTPDAVFSCIASRTGGPADAWRVERDANLNLLAAARRCGVPHFVLLSAICVQKPRLAFQHAKLAFEAELRKSGLRWSIVRPTAYFKSLAGQIRRVRDGKPFLVFGDGTLTACKPIGERDLARFLADCLDDVGKHDAIMPIGGPGPAITPRAQGELLFELTDRPPKFRRVPPALLQAVGTGLRLAARVLPMLADKAELARIGHYYATESMLVWNEQRARYLADATPEFGTETLQDFYERVLEEGLIGQDLGQHAVFDRRSP
ncbi:MAG: NAD(P)H-binding protein [Xanthomonadales bacterium]|nr:NAD(P)H-binding protein [Xanthomonadales bacterium]